MDSLFLLVLAVLLLWLAAAVGIDLRERRIPNIINLSGALIGLGCGLFAGWDGLGTATLGLLTGLALFLPLHASGILGAGDVKLLAAASAFLGPLGAVNAALFTLVAGGVYAMATLVWHDGACETLGRYWFGIRHLLTSGKWLGSREPDEAGRPLRFPYAIAIATGVLLAVWLPILGSGGLVAWTR